MAVVDTHTKQSTEKYPLEMDFSNRLDVGETVSTAAVTIKHEVTGTDTGSTMLDGSPSISGGDTIVSPIVQAGTDQNDYILQFKATTSASNVFEEEVRIAVRDV